MKTSLERDAEAFVRLLPALLSEHAGKVVLIRAGDQIKICETKDEALAEGYRRFKREPFFVKEIAPLESPAETTPDSELCRT